MLHVPGMFPGVLEMIPTRHGRTDIRLNHTRASEVSSQLVVAA